MSEMFDIDVILLEAAENNNFKKVKECLEIGADPNISNVLGNSPLHLAINHTNQEMATCLIEANANVDAQNFYHETPLHNAVTLNDPKSVALLLNAGANPNIEGTYGTSLDKAIDWQIDDIDIYRLLLINGGKVIRCKDKYEEYKFLSKGIIQLLKLYDPQLNAEALIKAINNHDVNKALEYITYGADVNYIDENGWNPLHHAATIGCDEVIPFLIEAGVDINTTTTSMNHTPLHLSIINSHDDTARLLIDAGVDLSSTNKLNATALDLAKSLKIKPIILLLEEKLSKHQLTEEANMGKKKDFLTILTESMQRATFAGTVNATNDQILKQIEKVLGDNYPALLKSEKVRKFLKASLGLGILKIADSSPEKVPQLMVDSAESLIETQAGEGLDDFVDFLMPHLSELAQLTASMEDRKLLEEDKSESEKDKLETDNKKVKKLPTSDD